MLAESINQFNNMESLLSYRQTWAFDKFINCEEKVIGLFTGNQALKTSATAYQYVLRILGIHPVPDRNVLYYECESRACPNKHRYLKQPEDGMCQKCGEDIGKFTAHKFTINTVPKDGICPICKTDLSIHKRGTRIFRFASQVLPYEKETTGEGGQSAEIKNAVYPEFKKWLPQFLIKKDITFRSSKMILHDPNGQGDIIAEFSAYSQPVKQGAGVQRMSIWEDEEAPYEFHKEQIPRLFSENGDLIITLTPANKMTWTYDEIYEKARVYYRTKSYCDFMGTEQITRTDSPNSIAVIQASSYDNPTLDKAVIDQKRLDYDDPADVAIRIYGVFHQSSGRIFNDWDYAIHFIDGDKYFPDGMYHDWLHARMVDYHEVTPLAIPFIALSPYNEAFIYREYNPSPEKNTTSEITHQIASMSGDFKYSINLMDPLGTKTQTNTGVSVMDDFNRHFWQYKKEGIGTGGFWDSWDTKSTKGRDAIRERLKNAKKVGVPFNNTVVKDGREIHLPTLWVFNICKTTAASIKNWRKDDKGKPEQRHSHFCTAIEAVMKDSRFRPKKGYSFQKLVHRKRRRFQGARA